MRFLVSARSSKTLDTRNNDPSHRELENDFCQVLVKLLKAVIMKIEIYKSTVLFRLP